MQDNNPTGHALRNRMLRWIETQGVVPCYEPEALDKLRRLLRCVGPFFWLELEESRTVLLYTYHQDEQGTQGLREQDGVAWRNVTSDLGNLHAIGISSAALSEGVEDAISIFIHELAHITAQADHDDPLFATTLDELYGWYSEAWTGVETAITPARASSDGSPEFIRAVPLPQKKRILGRLKSVFERVGVADE